MQLFCKVTPVASATQQWNGGNYTHVAQVPQTKQDRIYDTWKKDETVKADLHITDPLWAKLCAMMCIGANNEIAVYGTVVDNTLTWLHTGIMGGPGAVHIPVDGVMEASLAAYKAGHGTTNLHAHTHPGFGVYFSTVDNKDHVDVVTTATDMGVKEIDFWFIVLDGVKGSAKRFFADDGNVRYNMGEITIRDEEPTPLDSSRGWGYSYKRQQTQKQGRKQEGKSTQNGVQPSALEQTVRERFSTQKAEDREIEERHDQTAQERYGQDIRGLLVCWSKEQSQIPWQHLSPDAQARWDSGMQAWAVFDTQEYGTTDHVSDDGPDTVEMQVPEVLIPFEDFQGYGYDMKAEDAIEWYDNGIPLKELEGIAFHEIRKVAYEYNRPDVYEALFNELDLQGDMLPPDDVKTKCREIYGDNGHPSWVPLRKAVIDGAGTLDQAEADEKWTQEHLAAIAKAKLLDDGEDEARNLWGI